MKVSLVNFTDDALNVLLRTKNTRLSYEDDPAGWTEEKKAEHLQYMLTTIKSSWEFVDFHFHIEGVTRAFTHELVRHRHGSYAQQSMRVVNAREFDADKPESVTDNIRGASEVWDATLEQMMMTYAAMVDWGVPTQDARGILPTNILTNIDAKFNLRTLHEMAKVRLCTRAAKEFQDVMRAMRDLVVFHYPWAADMINVQCVADGTCAFPRYGKAECPVYSPAMDNTKLREDVKKVFWSLRHEATPVAKDGKAM